MELDKIKSLDIFLIAGVLGIDVQKLGQNYNGSCPFHSEKTPSFVLFSATNTWHCFGCQLGGSNVDLVMEKLGMDFPEALNWLRDRFVDFDTIVKINQSLKSVKNNFQHKAIDLTMIMYWHNLLYHTGEDQMFRKRGFSGSTISRLGFGWDGQRYIIPVWLGVPWKSPCIGVRKRASQYLDETVFKYIGKKGYNKPCVFNRHTTVNQSYMFSFAGELDSALCWQDGFSTVSLVNGMSSFSSFPKNWGYLWFPSVKKNYIIFDRNEAHVGGKLAAEWETQKGRNTGFVIHWPNTLIDNIPDFGYHDYNDFRLCSVHHTQNEFIEICMDQLPMGERNCLLKNLRDV